MTFKNMSKQRPKTEVEVLDARKKEQEEGLSKREFFNKYGFVLLSHHTNMTADDWLVNSQKPIADSKNLERLANAQQGKDAANPVETTYAKEIEPLLSELVPNAGELKLPKSALRRGPGGPNNFYGLGVHQDFGLYKEDMETLMSGMHRAGDDESISYDEWCAKLDRDGNHGYAIINFWRPVLPMKRPVQNTPLAVCDPNTVNVEDIVPQDLYGFAPKGQHNMGIKFNPNQKWYYYPDMTTEEVLVFRQFQYEKGWKAPYKKINTVFHTAFQHPGAPKDAEKRCSSEYRVSVWLK